MTGLQFYATRTGPVVIGIWKLEGADQVKLVWKTPIIQVTATGENIYTLDSSESFQVKVGYFVGVQYPVVVKDMGVIPYYNSKDDLSGTMYSVTDLSAFIGQGTNDSSLPVGTLMSISTSSDRKLPPIKFLFHVCKYDIIITLIIMLI